MTDNALYKAFGGTMRLSALLFGFALLFISACAPALPPPIDETLLEKATPAEAQALETLERSLIDFPDRKIEKNKENKKLTKARDAARQELAQAESALKEAQNKLAALKKKGSPEQLKAAENQAREQEITQERKRQKLAYHQMALELGQTQLEMLDAEIALKVAEQRLSQAKIGRRVQEAQRPPEPEAKEGEAKKDKKQDEGMISLKIYEKYLQYQQQEFEKLTLKLRRAETKLAQAKAAGPPKE